jgi:tryptophan-rich sensory protein
MADAEKGAGIDWPQVAKYPFATSVQFLLIAMFFKAVDTVTIPAPLVPVLFAFLSLRSRLFSLLPANRPPRGGFEVDGKKVPTTPETIRPWWTPPGIAFPFIWLTITALRAASSLVVFKEVGQKLFSAPLLLLALHLCVGDTWNCVTNVEQRKGVSALGVLAVWTSVVAAVKAYYEVTPLAGYLLAPSACWISIASVLTWTIWKINPPLQPLLPQQGDGQAADMVLPLVFRPREAWKVISTPPVGPPQKKSDAV